MIHLQPHPQSSLLPAAQLLRLWMQQAAAPLRLLLQEQLLHQKCLLSQGAGSHLQQVLVPSLCWQLQLRAHR
jgi:hypothetical protein